MADPPRPHVSPPPPSYSPKSNLHMLYYGLVVVGTAAVVLGLYNLIIIKWCTEVTDQRARQRANRGPGSGLSFSRSFQSFDTSFVHSYKYKKDGVEQEEGKSYECAVCLSVFEEGEELRQLPKCKHSFHASCIDMWLYSHMDCPLCRSPVEPPGLGRCVVAEKAEHSREGLLGQGLV